MSSILILQTLSKLVHLKCDFEYFRMDPSMAAALIEQMSAFHSQLLLPPGLSGGLMQGGGGASPMVAVKVTTKFRG